MIEILVQSRRNRRAAERFFRKLLKGQGKVPLRLVTDKLKSFSAALRTTMPSVNHDTERHANNRAEVSHQPTRQRERQMRRFKSPRQAQLFLFGPRYRPESFPIGKAQTKSGSSPHVEGTFCCDLASGHGSLINCCPLGIASAGGGLVDNARFPCQGNVYPKPIFTAGLSIAPTLSSAK